MPYILPLAKITSDHKEIVGEKAYSLSQLHRYGLPVCHGFVITAKTQQALIQHNNLHERIANELSLYDLNNADAALSATRRVQNLITTSQLPPEFSQELFDQYDDFKTETKSEVCSMRTSLCTYNTHDVPHPLFLNVRGEHTLAEILKELYSQLFTPNILIRHKKHHFPQTAVIVHQMFECISSGLVHTVDPYSKNKRVYTVEAVWGLAEILAKKNIPKDKYTVDKQTNSLLLRKTYPQHVEFVPRQNTLSEISIPFSKQLQPKLNDTQILKLISYITKLKPLSVHPQTVEWGFDGKEFTFFQTQTLTENTSWQDDGDKARKLHMPVLMEGYGDNPGIGTGLTSYSTSHDQSFAGEIVILEQYDREIMDVLTNTNGIINTDSDNKREVKLFCEQHGIPLVHIHPESKSYLKGGEYITIDGSSGYIYKSAGKQAPVVPYEREITIEPLDVVYTQIQPILTKIKVYLDIQDMSGSEVYDAALSDGIAVVPGESLIRLLPYHPQYYVQHNKLKEMESSLSDTFKTLESKCGPCPIFYKLSDLQSVDAHSLKQSSTYESVEQNPLLGFRGAWRHVQQKQILEAELRAAASSLRQRSGSALVFPFIRHSQELEVIDASIKTVNGLSILPKWLYVGSPANCINIPQYTTKGFRGVVIDMKHLTMLTLGIDPRVPSLSQLYDEFDPAVLWLIKRLTQHCKQNKLSCVITNFHSPLDQDRLSVLLQNGIDGVSVYPQYLLETKKTVAALEKEHTQ